MLRTLIVDDEASTIKGLINFIDWERYNCQIVSTASNAEDAIKLAGSNSIDLFITDICLPDLDGINLIKKIKNINPNIRIIVISAYDKFSYVKDALKLGVENYLLKPIDQVELCDTLQKIMENVDNNFSSNLDDISVFKNNILNMWVKNSISEYSLKYHAEFADINLSSRQYCVFLLESINENFEFDHNIISLCKGLFKNEGYFFLENSTRLVGLLTSFSSLYKEILIKLSHYMSNTFLSVGIPVASYKDVSISYSLALKYTIARFMLKESIIFSQQFIKLNNRVFIDDTLAIRVLALKEKINEVLQYWINLLDSIESFETQKSESISIVVNILNAVYLDNLIQNSVLTGLLNEFITIDNTNILHKWIKKFVHSAFKNNLFEINSVLHPYVKDTIDIVKAKYKDENLSLKTIASSFSVNSAYLGQLFKTHTGKYFHDYLSDYRLTMVENLLLESDSKISDIAIMTGFTTQSYLNKIFKKKYNLSPLEFRREHNKLNASI
jgi:two-component system, response regulator YesN